MLSEVIESNASPGPLQTLALIHQQSMPAIRHFALATGDYKDTTPLIWKESTPPALGSDGFTEARENTPTARIRKFSFFFDYREGVPEGQGYGGTSQETRHLKDGTHGNAAKD
jgi:hypothetical protein